MVELPGAKKKNRGSSDKKDRERSLLFVFDAVVLNSMAQYKK
jgi:hypothetical protein